MKELVLALHWDELRKQHALPEGLCGFDLNEVDQQAYALLPRHIADNKKELLDSSLALGKIFPQILGYFQVVNPNGSILTYQRKGKEEGLLGKWSIGVGGHINQEDLLNTIEHTGCAYPNLLDIVLDGSIRELEEELGIQVHTMDMFATVGNFSDAIKSVLHTWDDDTSTMHVGMTTKIELTPHMMDSLKLEPAEFLNYKWLTPDELKLSGLEFETWSAILIDHM